MQWAEPVVPQRFGLCRAVAFRLCLSDPLSPSLGQQQRGTGAVARGALNHPERRWRSNLQGSGVAGAVAGDVAAASRSWGLHKVYGSPKGLGFKLLLPAYT